MPSVALEANRVIMGDLRIKSYLLQPLRDKTSNMQVK